MVNAKAIFFDRDGVLIEAPKFKNLPKSSKNIKEIKRYDSVPTLAGFGIKSIEDAKLLADCSDGVIIGSSLVQMIEQGSEKKEFDRIGKYISEIKKAIS